MEARVKEEVLMFDKIRQIFDKILKSRKMKKAQKRIAEFGYMFDTIDSLLITKKYSDQARMDFWWRFIADQDYRVKFIQDMAKGNV
jgi:hypothetical protein